MIPKTIAVIEGGLFQPLCHSLVGQFERVLYFRPWQASFPHSNDIAIGRGYEFERIDSIFEHIKDIDIFCFPDIGFGDLQEYLRAQGKATFGSGVAQEFEQYRVEAKDIIREAGLPVNDYEVVEGMDALREYLKAHEDVYVKLSMARGVTESFHSASYDLVKVKLDEIEHKLGGMASQQEWIVEQPVEAKGEIGFDGVTIGGQFWNRGICGVEKKDAAYFAAVKPYGELPAVLRTVNERLAPDFQLWKYNGWWSTECRGPYLIDPTCRMASPAGECYLDLVANWGEIIDAGSQGVMVQPVFVAKFAAQAMLCCPMAAESWVPVFIEPEVRSKVKLYHSCIQDGVEYVVPTDAKMKEIGSVVGIGNTPQQAWDGCKKAVEGIQAYGLTAETEAIGGAIEELRKFTAL